MNADGSNPRRITPWPLRGGDHPDWSPDGKRILFRSNQEGPDRVPSNIYTVRVDGSGLHRLTHARAGSGRYLSSSFSPDGTSITFARTIGTDNADVFVMRANGSAPRNVTRPAIWDSAPDWGSAR
jgi:TolB protein